MNFPHYKNKHVLEALYDPIDYIKYKKLIGKSFPKKYILSYMDSVKNYFYKKYKPKKLKLTQHINIAIHKDIGFVQMIGIGSPHAIGVFEELIALGGKIFLNIGTAGGLHKEGVFLCQKALRDEGTSHHYLPFGKYSYPNKALTEKFGNSLKKHNIKYFEGTTWTIDAPYRETIAEVEKYAKQKITTVEMEASALFAVAEYRKVQIASAFIVSDVLGKEWSPNFHRIDVKKTHNQLIDAGVDCLIHI